MGIKLVPTYFNEFACIGGACEDNCCIGWEIGIDPAVMASPFITTIVDALSLLIYFFFATRLLAL